MACRDDILLGKCILSRKQLALNARIYMLPILMSLCRSVADPVGNEIWVSEHTLYT